MAGGNQPQSKMCIEAALGDDATTEEGFVERLRLLNRDLADDPDRKHRLFG